MRRLALLLSLSLLLAPLLGLNGSGASAPPYGASSPPPDHAVESADRGAAPLMFVENVGQFAGEGRFQARIGSGTLWLAEDALWLSLPVRSADVASAHGVNVRLSFVGSNRFARLEPFCRLDTCVSYFRGNDPSRWCRDVPVWGGVRYLDLYPGVDLEITGEGGRWSWRLVGPNRSPMILDAVPVGEREVALGKTGYGLRADGVDALGPDGSGGLRLSTGLGEYSIPSPCSTGSGTVLDDASELLYGTYLGGGEAEEHLDIAVDSNGAAYVAGSTVSPDFPTTAGAFGTPRVSGGWDAFVVKLNASGTNLIYCAFLGGDEGNPDEGRGIAVDQLGNAYVTGHTFSADFPTTAEAYDRTHNGEHDAFVVKVNATGSDLDYATFLGGTLFESGSAIAIDTAGGAYVVGETVSSDFPTTSGALDTSYGGGSQTGDGFAAKLNPTGNTLVYSTYLGGSLDDQANSVAVNASMEAYVAGDTLSTDFPTTSGVVGPDLSGNQDGFVVRLSSDGSNEIYGTYLGGPNWEWTNAIAVDGSDAAYVVGTSSDIPTTAGAYDTTADGLDAFVAKLNSSASAFVYCTMLGGSGADAGKSLAVDGDGAAYVAGETISTDFPTTAGAFDTSHGGGTCGTPPDTYACDDAFVAKLSPSGGFLEYATYLGGSSADVDPEVAVDSSGAAYVSGRTESTDFPTTAEAHDRTLDGRNDAFVVKLALAALEPVPTATTPPVCPDQYEPNEDFASAITMAPGLDIQSYICNAQDLDWFKFDVTAGEVIIANLTNLPADYDLYLYDPEEAFIECSTCAGAESENITHTALSSGAYRVLIRGFDYNHWDDANPYTLNVGVVSCPDQYEPNDSFEDAIEITSGTEIQSYVCDEADVDWFKFDVGAGQWIVVGLTNLPEDYDLELHDPTGVIVRESAFGGTTSEQIEWFADSAGAWRVKVSGYDASFDAANPYTLKVQVGVGCPDQYEPNEDFGTAIEIAPFAEIESYICSPTDEDWFKFEVSAGQLITVDLTSLPQDYDLELRGPNESVIDISGDVGQASERVGGIAALSGDYRVYIYGFNDVYDRDDPYALMVQLGGGPTHGTYLPLVLKGS